LRARFCSNRLRLCLSRLDGAGTLLAPLALTLA
jgi:hypothetical protein